VSFLDELHVLAAEPLEQLEGLLLVELGSRASMTSTKPSSVARSACEYLKNGL
jgi:hypothetical protein